MLEVGRGLAPGGSCAALDRLAEQLDAVDPTALAEGHRLAFWVNLYNAALLHELCRHPRSGNLIRHRSIFRRSGYRVGGEGYTLNVIEHGLLRTNRRPPYGLRPPLRRGDARLAAAPRRLDPRVHFALNCGARSCPPIRSYSAERIGEELEVARRAYLAAESGLDRESATLTLPGLMRLYRRDFGPVGEQVALVMDVLAPADAEWLRENRDRLRVRYGRFDWTMTAPARPGRRN
jgi:hypothetical protein